MDGQHSRTRKNVYFAGQHVFPCLCASGPIPGIFNNRPSSQDTPEDAKDLNASASRHFISNTDTLASYKLPLECQIPAVAEKLWRRVLLKIQEGTLPLRADAEVCVCVEWLCVKWLSLGITLKGPISIQNGLNVMNLGKTL
jgi:hypothetical protein